MVFAMGPVTSVPPVFWCWTPPLVFTAPGLWCAVVVPSPSWPLVFAPHHHTLPVYCTPQVWSRPLVTVRHDVLPILTGALRWTIVPSPTDPTLL